MRDSESYSYELFDIEALSYSYYGDVYSYASDFEPAVDRFESVTSLDVSCWVHSLSASLAVTYLVHATLPNMGGIFNPMFLLLRGAIVNRTKYC